MKLLIIFDINQLHPTIKAGCMMKSRKKQRNACLFISCINAFLHLVDISIDSCYGYDVNNIADRGTEVDEVDGLVQSHLNRADDFHICIEHLQHLVA